MTIKQIFNLGIQTGIKADFRCKNFIKQLLKTNKNKYNQLSPQKRKFFDKESLTNPYLDSRILYQSKKTTSIKKILVGIDIGPGELILAKQLGNIDLVISHHPLGQGLANLAQVMELQCDVLNKYGVPINIAEGLMKKRISEVAREVNSSNHQRSVDMAKELDINLMCLHTPCDNLAADFLRKKIKKNKSKLNYLQDIIDLLLKIPEYQESAKIGAGPKIFAGSKEDRCGKIALTEITGGTEGSPKLYEKMAQAGIGTVIGMHISEKHKQQADKNHIRVIIAGHISSDSLGINLFLDKLENKGIKIKPISGLIRYSRNKIQQ